MNSIDYADKIARLLRKLSMYRCKRLGNVIWWGGDDNALITVTEYTGKQSLHVRIQKEIPDGAIAVASFAVSRDLLDALRMNPANLVWPTLESFEETYMIDLTAAPSTVCGIHALKDYRTRHPDPIRSGWHLQPLTRAELVRIIEANPHMREFGGF
jgi:hypothetical protein